MSSKKKYTTIGLPLELFEKVEQAALEDQRSKGFIIEKILKKHYEVVAQDNEARGQEQQNANRP